jgi:hypothetical protein
MRDLDLLENQMNNIYRDKLVKMKSGDFFKIKKVIGWNIPAALITVEYAEGARGDVDTRDDKLHEA